MKRLRIAYIVQRYGLEVNGGAEAHCRILAEHLARTHDVEILTTRAIDYVTWKNEYPDGIAEVNGVRVRRFGVDRPRDQARFTALSERVLVKAHSPDDEIEWMKAQGPYTSGLLEFLNDQRSAYDVFLFQTYLYATTFFGLPVVRDKAVLIPTAHDELPIYLGIFDKLFEQTRVLLCLSPEERAFLARRFFDARFKAEVIGAGMEPAPAVEADLTWEALRRKLGDSPFVLYVGRIDELKGCKMLVEYFERFVAESAHGDLKLLLMGKEVMRVPPSPRIVLSGFVPEATKWCAIRACRLMVAPSFYESLCMAILEAWQLGKPVLVNGHCAVLRGQAIRSNGGLWFSNYEEFRHTLSYLLENDSIAAALGKQGQEFVNTHYTWEAVDERLWEILSAPDLQR